MPPACLADRYVGSYTGRFSETESGEVRTDHYIGRLPSPESAAFCFGLGPNGGVLVAAVLGRHVLWGVACVATNVKLRRVKPAAS